MPDTTLDPALIEAYRRTSFRVTDAGFSFAMSIDQPCEALLECMRRCNVTEAAYFTAWNPRSEPTPRQINEAAQRELEARLQSQEWHFLAGEAVGSDGSWLPEPSILVLGMPAATASALAREYGQNAMVTARVDHGAVPRLVLLI
jgi:hypothetical protein